MSKICLDNFFSHGSWAVVDAFTGSIWINVEQQLVAGIISDCMSSKLNAVLIDISKAKNYQPLLIDSSEVQNWSLEKNAEIFTSGLSSQFDSNKNRTRYTADGLVLINSPCDSLLDESQKSELRVQIFSLVHVIKTLWPETYWNGVPVDPNSVDFLNLVFEPYTIELTISDIENKLIELCHDNMYKYPKLCLTLLWELGEFFE
jgi:hypothetical protein